MVKCLYLHCLFAAVRLAWLLVDFCYDDRKEHCFRTPGSIIRRDDNNNDNYYNDPRHHNDPVDR